MLGIANFTLLGSWAALHSFSARLCSGRQVSNFRSVPSFSGLLLTSLEQSQRSLWSRPNSPVARESTFWALYPVPIYYEVSPFWLVGTWSVFSLLGAWDFQSSSDYSFPNFSAQSWGDHSAHLWISLFLSLYLSFFLYVSPFPFLGCQSHEF